MATHHDDRVKRARLGKRESKTLEFKGEFDPTDARELVEIVKDLVAIANSGGGVIVVGLTSGATPTGADVSTVLSLDPADLTNAIHKYTRGALQRVRNSGGPPDESTSRRNPGRAGSRLATRLRQAGHLSDPGEEGAGPCV
jgi:hypothetical protein